MILQETTPRALSWAGRLAVLTVAALLLPVAPTRAQRDDEPRRESDRDDDAPRAEARGRRATDERERRRDGDAPERDAQLQKARAEVERMAAEVHKQTARMQADLQKAQAELQRQMHEAQAPLQKMHEELMAAQNRLAELEGSLPGRGSRDDGGPRVAPRPRPFPNPRPNLSFRTGGGIQPFPPDAPEAPAPPEPPVPPAAPGAPGLPAPPHGPGGMHPPGMPGGPGMVSPPGGMSRDMERRLADLERKLDRVLDEVAKLKRTPRPGDSEDRDDEPGAPRKR